MNLLEIVGPDIEKISFLAALIMAVIWLWREMAALNKKRDVDMVMWRDMSEKIMLKQIEQEKENVKVIEKNTAAFENWTDALEKLTDKIQS